VTFFRHVVFDLDDTILDTSGTLIPAAARRAIETMLVAMNSNDEVQKWLTRRADILRADPRADVWLKLAGGDDEIADIGRRAFFTHPIETLPDEAIRTTPGAFEILAWAEKHATLHLVTSGDLLTQQKKIERLGIGHFFDSIQVVDAKHAFVASDVLATKHDAFAKIQSRHPGLAAHDFLSIGNRVDTDLGEAKRHGWTTVWVRYGEHATLTPQNQFEIPDFEVASLSDLLSIWGQQFSDSESKGSTWSE
jgi:putative hydrolase of the HAD superfamily